jgi:CDP-diacylglycerol--serine O-phosphatidyltransferase
LSAPGSPSNPAPGHADEARRAARRKALRAELRAERRAARRERVANATVPLRKLIPNLITVAAMCSGVASLYFSSKPMIAGDDTNLKRAVGAIGMAAILDALDGRAARLLKATSRFGESLDSLADFVSFGIAPAVLLYRWSQGHASPFGAHAESVAVMTFVLFALCSALRLARFTATARKKKLNAKPSRFFTGLPTPAAAGAVLIPPMLELSDLGLRLPTWAVLLWTTLLAAHMVSRVPMYSGKGARVPRRFAVPLMVAIGLLVAGVAHDAWLTMSAVCLAYVLSAGLSARSAAAERRRDALLPPPEPDPAPPGSSPPGSSPPPAP